MRLAFVLLAACTQEHYFAVEDIDVGDWTLGLPLHGDGRMIVWIAHPPNDWRHAVGFVRFRCEDCALGDDHTDLDLPNPLFGASDRVEFSHLVLGTVTGDADFAGGTMQLDVHAKSSDFELDARVDADLSKRSEDIRIDGCVKFRSTTALMERDPRMAAIVSTTGAPLGPDERYYITLGGTLGNMRRLGRVCSLVR